VLVLVLVLPQVVFEEASAAAGRTVDRVVSLMDASSLSLSALTGFAQRVGWGLGTVLDPSWSSV
jgi:hypothetical protein